MKKRIRIGALVLAVLVAAMAGSVWAEDLTDGELEAVLSGNAKRLLNID